MKDYILFIPPIEVSEIRSRLWNSKQAKIYFDWFVSVKDDRVEYLLTVLDETLTSDAEADLDRISKKVTNLLFKPPFSEDQENELIITNKGLAMVADLSLLISKLIIQRQPEVTWKIVKRYKNDIAYNLPAMFGFPIIEHVELIGPAIVNAKAILTGEKSSAIWLEMYKYAINLLNGIYP